MGSKIKISIRHNLLQETDSLKLLGIFIGTNLIWNHLMDFVCKRVFQGGS